MSNRAPPLPLTIKWMWDEKKEKMDGLHQCNTDTTICINIYTTNYYIDKRQMQTVGLHVKLTGFVKMQLVLLPTEIVCTIKATTILSILKVLLRKYKEELFWRLPSK